MSISLDKNLNYNKRPEYIECCIDSAFNEIKNKYSCWSYNGESNYFLLEINEHELFAKMIQNAPEKRRNFYFLDIGAGNFQSVDACAQFINRQNLREGITVHIIGIRGELNHNEEVEEVGQCKKYKLGGFKIEHLFNEFQKRGLPTKGKLDVAVTQWTLCHCVDPVALVMQTHDLIRHKTGLFFFDAFHFTYKDSSFFNRVMNIPKDVDFSEPLSQVASRARIIQLLLDMKIPFLMRPTSECRGHDSFVLQRKTCSLATLPMQYSNILSTWDQWERQIAASGTFVEYERVPQEEDVHGFNFPRAGNDFDVQFFGDKTLFTSLRTYNLFKKMRSLPKCVPIRAIEDVQDRNKMRRNVNENDLSGIQEWIENVDINQEDCFGHTLLHWAVIYQKKQIFSFLLEQGASVHLSSSKHKKTPLAYAAAIDREGVFIKALLAAGADVDGKDDIDEGIAPLDCAINAKNNKAIALLLEKGAKLSRQNLETLESKEFLELHQQGLIPVEIPGNNFMRNIVDWIDKGYYVVLHENGSRVRGYFQEEKQTPIKKLIVMDFHPKENLLDPTELPGLIRVKPRLTSLAEFNQLDQTQFDTRFSFSLGY